MEDTNNKNRNEEEIRYYNREYNFKKVLCTPIILNQILLFSEQNDIQSLKLCCKGIKEIFYEYATQIKINKEINLCDLSKINFQKYENLRKLNLEGCKNISEFKFISKLEKLEELNLYYTNISDISFIENNKNLRKLDLEGCKNISEFKFISKLEQLEELNLRNTNISDISFLENNKNIRILD